MSRKTPSFAQLHDYIMRHNENGLPLVTQNLPESATDRSGRLKAFFDNDTHMKLRKGGLRAFHEVLSFHGGDAPNLTRDALQKLTEYYLQLRAPHALAIAEAHFDTEHPHIHIMISANELNSNKRVRLSRKEFAQVKLATEAHQLAMFPKLTRSVCQTQPTGLLQKAKDFKARLAASMGTNKREAQQILQRLTHAKPSSLKIFRPFRNLMPLHRDRHPGLAARWWRSARRRR